MRKRRPKSLFFFWDRLSITHKSDMLLPRIIFCISTALACQRIEEDTLFDLCHVFPCRYDGIGVDRDGIDAALDQEFSEVRIDARCLAADGNGLAVLMGYGNEMADSPFDCQVAFIEERCYRIVVAVAAHDEHGQVVGADGIAIDELVELVGQDDIGRDFSHEPDLEVRTAVEAFLSHEVDDFLHFIDAAAEGDHDVEVLVAVFFADFADSFQFQFEGFDVFRIIVTGSTAPAEEGAAFLGFVFVTACQVAVFTRFEVAQAQRDRTRSQCLADFADTFGQLIDDAVSPARFDEV